MRFLHFRLFQGYYDDRKLKTPKTLAQFFQQRFHIHRVFAPNCLLQTFPSNCQPRRSGSMPQLDLIFALIPPDSAPVFRANQGPVSFGQSSRSALAPSFGGLEGGLPQSAGRMGDVFDAKRALRLRSKDIRWQKAHLDDQGSGGNIAGKPPGT